MAGTHDLLTGNVPGPVRVPRPSMMADLVAAHDWASTSLGPPDLWPVSLRSAVSMCLATQFPVLVLWGPDLIKIYNDGYRSMIGSEKHPRALGAPAREIWPEIWERIGPMFDGVMATGEPTWSEHEMLLLERNGFAEECFFTFSYSALHDDRGDVAGVLDISVETTAEIVNGRRLATVADLNAALARVEHATDACVAAIGALNRHSADIVAADLILEVDGQVLPVASNRRRRLSAVRPSHVREAIAGGKSIVVGRPVGVGPADHMIVPFDAGSDTRGALVATLSPLRPFDTGFEDFVEMVADTVANAVERAVRRSEALGEVQRINETLQQAMLPSVRDSQTIAARYLPAADNLAVGGDWYDVIDLPDQRRAMVVGDCVGHGLAAATAMAKLRSAAQALLLEGRDPASAVSALDTYAASVEGGSCASVVVMVIDRAVGTVTYCRAGHPPPLLLRSDSVAWLEAPGGPVLGVDPSARRTNSIETVVADDLIVLYTDGLIERRDRPFVEQMEVLSRVVADHRDEPIGDLADAVLGRLVTSATTDDVVLVAKRFEPEVAPAVA